MYIGKARGFGQRFDPPEPSPYLRPLYQHCSNIVRSSVTLAAIRNDIKENNSNFITERPKDVKMDKAIAIAAKAFELRERVPLLHLNDVFKQDLPIWTSSPGLPWTNLGYKKKSDIRDDPSAVQRIRYYWHRIKCGQNINPTDCCAYVRSHLCEDGEQKVRAVWGYPATITFGEAVFALPLIKQYQKQRTPIAYGFESGNGGTRRLFKTFRGSHFLGIDFKKFDKRLPAWLIDIAFDILRRNLDFTRYQDTGIPDASAMHRMYDYIRHYCINTTIRMCNGERYATSAGLASGSYFTQLIGSVCNYILLTYSALVYDVEIMDILVFGDDSILGLLQKLTPQMVSDALEVVGMVVNTEKSGYSEKLGQLSFLGFKINDGFPSKDFNKQLASLVWPERNDREWSDVASRALGIMYANLGIDPIIDHWCRKIVRFKEFELHLTRDLDRYLRMLGITIENCEPPSNYDFLCRLGAI